VLRDNNIAHIRKATEYWVKMAQEPHHEIQKKWAECEKGWEKINLEMKGINLPEFVSPEDFVDLHNIVKRHEEQDSTWIMEIAHVASMALGQIKQFMEHPIKARAALQRLSIQTVKYRERAVEVKDILSTPMDQHMFPYENTCEDLFVKWSEYEKSHPL
jgi:hypothetical protein